MTPIRPFSGCLNRITLIILMEKSAPEFHAVSPHYLHKEIRKYDSGAEVNYLTKTIYISLDTFRKVVQNIDNELHAWLTFLSSNDSKDIIRLVTAYPEFLSCYHDIAEYRKTPRELINMYSEALAILDRNTVKYMCEEQQKEIEEQQRKIEELRAEKVEKDSVIAEKDSELQRALTLLKQHGIVC